MFEKRILLFLFNIFLFIVSINALKELEELTEIKKIMEKFDSISSDPGTIFSVYLNDDASDADSRYQFYKDLENNKENIRNFGDFPYNPTGEIDQNEYKSLEKQANENRANILGHFEAIESALKYLNDILSRYQYMNKDDKKEQATTVIKYILGQAVLPEDSLPTRLPALISTDCMNWLDSELQLLAYQYDHTDESSNADYEDYSRINLTQCLNYITAGYSMVISAKQAEGQDDAQTFYDQYSVGVKELISNHEASIKKRSAKSSRKAALVEELYENDALTVSKLISFIFLISQIIIIILL